MLLFFVSTRNISAVENMILCELQIWGKLSFVLNISGNNDIKLEHQQVNAPNKPEKYTALLQYTKILTKLHTIKLCKWEYYH